MKKALLFMAAFVLSIPTMLAEQVTFYFSSDDVDDAYQYVVCEDLDNGGYLDIPGPMWEYTYDESSYINLASIDEDQYTITVLVNGDPYTDYNTWVEPWNDSYDFMLNKQSNGFDFQIIVEKIGGPGVSSVMVSYDVYSYDLDLDDMIYYGDIAVEDIIKVYYWDRELMQEIPLPVNFSYGMFSVVPGTTVEVRPLEGYSVTVYSWSDEISEPSYDPSLNTYYIYFPPDIATEFVGISFCVDYAEAPEASFTLNFESSEDFDFSSDDPIYYSPWECVTIQAPVGYDIEINGNSNKITLPEGGIEFSVAPKAGYEIANLTYTFMGRDISEDYLYQFDTYVEYVAGQYEIKITGDEVDGLEFNFDIVFAKEENEEITVNFELTGSSDAYQHVYVTDYVTWTDVVLSGNSFQWTYGEDGASFYFVTEYGYKVDYQNTGSSDGSQIMIIPFNDREFFVDMSYMPANNNATVTIAIVEAVEGEPIPVTFNVAGYPGLIAALVWDGKEEMITNDSQLENYTVSFLYNDWAYLDLFFAVTEDHDPLYTVKEVIATYVDADGQTFDCYVELYAPEAQACVEIPYYAKSVNISFDATPNETAVSSIEKLNEAAEVYNLQGIRVNSDNLKSGIYIVNGKKVIVRK